MAIPASSDELERFTPPSLANLPIPPVFLLRPADGREQRRFERHLMEEGLRFNGVDDFRAETLRGIDALYSPDAAEGLKVGAQSFWTLLDQQGEPTAKDAAIMAELNDRLLREWRPLSRMAADNKMFNDESGRIAVSMFLVGWTGLDLSYVREGGVVPLKRIDDLETKLAALEDQGRADKVEGVGRTGTAWIQLATAAFLKLVLTKAAEKNSSSPPPSPPAPNGSTPRRSKRTRARSSKASASTAS